MKIVCLDAKTLGDINLSRFGDFGEFKSFEFTLQNERISRLKDVDIVITNKVIIDKEVMDNTDLKLICISATGMNNVDLHYAKQKGICVKNVAGYSTNSVVQQTFTSLFYLTNRVKYFDEWVKDGNWVKSEIFTHLSQNIYEIYGKNFGIIGLGEIGKCVGRVAKSFGANVMYFSTSGKNSSSEFQRVDLDELLKNCDFISINCALNENSRNLIGKKELCMLKNGAILMNFARGGIVDEKALAIAIDENKVRAILDVLQDEPMSENSPLLRIKNTHNLLITPHIAWGSVEARNKLIDSIYKNISDFLG